MDARIQATPLFTAICVLIGVLVIVQLWLLSASLEASLSGDRGAPIPATIASAVLFGVSGRLLYYVLSLDRRFSK
jgi:hypothetical protein